MSGHSKFHTIKATNDKADAARGKNFKNPYSVQLYEDYETSENFYLLLKEVS